MNTIIQVEELQKKYGEWPPWTVSPLKFRKGRSLAWLAQTEQGRPPPSNVSKVAETRSGISVCWDGPAKSWARFERMHGMRCRSPTCQLACASGKRWICMQPFIPQQPIGGNCWSSSAGRKAKHPFSKLSGGQKQRLFIALALLPKPI